jgi:myosin-crossreactive antigen
MLLTESYFDREVIQDICKRAKGVSNYTQVYELTYNQLPPKTAPIIEFMQEHELIEGKKIMEIMSGNGFETKHIRNTLPENNYVCSDINDYSAQTEGLTFHQIDCTDKNYSVGDKHSNLYDLVFIGGANASMCMLKNLQEIIGLSIFLKNTIKKEGFAILSYFEEHFFQTNFTIDYSVSIIHDFKDPSKNGLYAHWFCGMKRDLETQFHHYYDLVAVSPSLELKKSTKYTEIFYNTEPFTARSWQTAIVMEIMENAGFKYVGSKWNVEPRLMPFQKIR